MGSRFLRRPFKVLEPEGPHAWLFQMSRLSKIVKTLDYWSLPWPQKIFWSYVYLFVNFYKGKLPLGNIMFFGCVGMSKLLGQHSYYLVTVDGSKLYLAVEDPRAFQAIIELIDSGSDAYSLKYFIGKGNTFIDVGANYGVFSVVASKLVGPTGMVVSIEPQPLLAKLVKKNLEANGESPFQVFECGCSDREGSTELFVPRGSSGAAGVYKSFSATGEHRVLKVGLKRLDDLVLSLRLPGSLFVKLDVEGHELAALKGCRDLIRERKPKLMIEINNDAMHSAGVSIEDYVAFLKAMGYKYFVWMDRPLQAVQLDILPKSQISLKNIVVIK
ncbi:methyltransferase, FkbM family [Desulfacinum hydrothermale DSM 13146]|uniref:Methyltransferase, FkbM family n=2 Tax=Desulfacinum hydrothermale TaxID=109258 RepID=A0A1W1XR77_9BACT|nr:methyltransferase, FkbM family [Desulfacinum hydrothermale DSM 13146]